MCFEQSHHKWILETHVASRYGAVTRAEIVPWFSGSSELSVGDRVLVGGCG